MPIPLTTTPCSLKEPPPKPRCTPQQPHQNALPQIRKASEAVYKAANERHKAQNDGYLGI